MRSRIATLSLCLFAVVVLASPAHALDLARVSSATGVSAMVDARGAWRFQGLIRDLEAAGYGIATLCGRSWRNIAGTHVLSKHAVGDALDVNQLARNRVLLPLPANATTIAARWGLVHGAVWRHPDQGHFEIPGPNPGRRHARRRHRRGRA